jgi:RHS repeat-associated protein
VSNPYRSPSDPTYGVTAVAYDALNRPTSVTDPDNSIATALYSLNTATLTDEAGKKRQFQFDALGRITQVTEDPAGLGYVTTYGFDALDNLKSVVQGSAQRAYAFDSLSRMISETNPESGTVNFKYDADSNCGNSAAGLLASRTDARGVRTCYFYDSLNRLTRKTYSDGTPALYFSYDVAPSWMSDLTNVVGRLVEASNQYAGSSGSSAAARVNSYDSMGRVIRQWQQTPSTSPGGFFVYYSYDLAGDSTQMTYPSGRVVQQSFDSAGRLCAVAASTSNCSTLTSPYASAFTYDPASQLTGFNYGNGVAATFGYSNRLQMSSLKYAIGTNTLFNLVYNFGSTNNNGQIAGITDNVDNGRSVVYGYDSLNRLSSALTTGSTNYPKWGLSWGYDRNSNRTAQNVTAGIGPYNSVGVDPTTNRINTSGYGYDVGGNMTNDASNTLAYNAENQVTSATNGSGSGTYTYDADGLRVEKVSGTTTDSVYSGSQVIAQYSGTQLLAEYVFAGGQQLAMLAPANVQNASFETTNPLNYSCGTGCAYNAGPIPGWTLTGGGGSFQPSSTYFNLPLPSGSIVAYSNGGTISQTLQAALQPNSTYTLSVYIGHRLDGDVTNYTISLQAGSTVLNTVTGSNGTIAAGSFAKVTLTYSTGATVTSGDLAIVLSSSGTQIDFDNVQFSGAASPLYFHPDHLSTRLMTDASGNLAGQQAHFPFGETWYAQNTTAKWQFTSYEHDAESGNEYALARSYINRLARFSSPDPAGLAAVDATNPQSWNRYAYVMNNPLNFTDPTGLCPPFDDDVSNCTFTSDPPGPGGMCGAEYAQCIQLSPGTWLGLSSQSSGQVSSIAFVGEYGDHTWTYSLTDVYILWDPWGHPMGIRPYLGGPAFGPSAGKVLIDRQFAQQQDCSREVLNEGLKEFTKPELPDFGPPIQVPNPGGEELAPPPEPNPVIKDLLEKGSMLAILQMGHRACQEQFPLSRLHP